LFAIQSTDVRQVFLFFPITTVANGKRWIFLSTQANIGVCNGQDEPMSDTD